MLSFHFSVALLGIGSGTVSVLGSSVPCYQGLLEEKPRPRVCQSVRLASKPVMEGALLKTACGAQSKEWGILGQGLTFSFGLDHWLVLCAAVLDHDSDADWLRHRKVSTSFLA